MESQITIDETLNQRRSVEVCRAFETFDEFIKYRNGNLKMYNYGSLRWRFMSSRRYRHNITTSNR